MNKKTKYYFGKLAVVMTGSKGELSVSQIELIKSKAGYPVVGEIKEGLFHELTSSNLDVVIPIDTTKNKEISYSDGIIVNSSSLVESPSDNPQALLAAIKEQRSLFSRLKELEKIQAATSSQLGEVQSQIASLQKIERKLTKLFGDNDDEIDRINDKLNFKRREFYK